MAAAVRLQVGPVRERDLDLDEHVAGAGLGAGNVLEPEVARAVEDERSHGVKTTFRARRSRWSSSPSVEALERKDDRLREVELGQELHGRLEMARRRGARPGHGELVPVDALGLERRRGGEDEHRAARLDVGERVCGGRE